MDESSRLYMNRSKVWTYNRGIIGQWIGGVQNDSRADSTASEQG